MITLDLRWHGQGIQAPEMSLYDCADDVAALADVLGIERFVAAGYSMGGAVAQRVWRQHPDRVEGLVLAATSAAFRFTPWERLFFTGLEAGMIAARGISGSRAAMTASRSAARALHLAPSDIHDWAMQEFRSTSPWAVGQALAALGRHHARPWLGRIDVPPRSSSPPATTSSRRRDRWRWRAPSRVRRLHEVDAGHASCVMQAERFVPVMVQAASTVAARRRDFGRHAPVEEPQQALTTGSTATSGLRRLRCLAPAAPAQREREVPRGDRGLQRRQLGREPLDQRVGVGHRLTAGDRPACSCPALESTVMLSPAPWKTGPSG